MDADHTIEMLEVPPVAVRPVGAAGAGRGLIEVSAFALSEPEELTAVTMT